MPDDPEQKTSSASRLRWAGVGAIAGAVISVVAGIGFGGLPGGAGSVLPYLAERPGWYWPLVAMGFVVGALLWLGAFSILGDTLDRPTSRAWWRLGMIAVTVGVVVHVLDSAIAGPGLGALAESVAGDGVDQEAALASADLILRIHEGLWAAVIALFHGLPFLLFGIALIVSHRYPTWLGWVGAIAGAASLGYGAAMFLQPGELPQAPYAVLGVVVSVWMILIGARLLRTTPPTAGSG